MTCIPSYIVTIGAIGLTLRVEIPPTPVFFLHGNSNFGRWVEDGKIKKKKNQKDYFGGIQIENSHKSICYLFLNLAPSQSNAPNIHGRFCSPPTLTPQFYSTIYAYAWSHYKILRIFNTR
jgi:hypothetical protein